MFGTMLFREWEMISGDFRDDICKLISMAGFRHKDTKSLVTAWTKAGMEYDKLSITLGGRGCLMLLPDWFSA